MTLGDTFLMSQGEGADRMWGHGRATGEQREKGMNNSTKGTPERERQARGKPKRVTRAVVRAKCLDCLGGRKWDCEIRDCALYPWQPWPGRAMPSR